MLISVIAVVAIILLFFIASYGSVCVLKQISKIKDEEEDDLYNYLRSREFKDSFAKTVKDDTWKKGLPMVYMDKNGWIVNHWKDGKIEKIKKVINI